MSFALKQIGTVERRRSDANENLVVGGRRCWTLLDFQNFRAAWTRDDRGSHDPRNALAAHGMIGGGGNTIAGTFNSFNSALNAAMPVDSMDFNWLIWPSTLGAMSR